MKKYLMLAALAMLFYSSAAYSRVCFLPDGNCGNGEVSVSVKSKNCKNNFEFLEKISLVFIRKFR